MPYNSLAFRDNNTQHILDLNDHLTHVHPAKPASPADLEIPNPGVILILAGKKQQPAGKIGNVKNTLDFGLSCAIIIISPW